jgi:selenocysteine lyase/cysteine desulfurase
VNVKSVVSAARAKAQHVGTQKLEFCIDCVAYAPHRRIDVQDWDVEYAFFSFYKVRSDSRDQAPSHLRKL